MTAGTFLLQSTSGSPVISRSLAFCELGGAPYLLAALGDGRLVSFTCAAALAAAGGGPSSSAAALEERKVVTLGTKPISLTAFSSRGAQHIFACCDRPAVIHASGAAAGGKLRYSNVDLHDASHMTPFATAAAGAGGAETFAIVTAGELIIGTIDEIQKLHIRTVPLAEQPRRIVHLEGARCFAVLTVRLEVTADGEETEYNYLRLFDDTTFERQGSYELQPTEAVWSLLTLELPGEEASCMLVVGTMYVKPEEQEPTSGRLLVFEVSAERALEVRCALKTKGGVYSLEAFHGRVLAGVNNKLQLYEWVAPVAGAAQELVLRSEHCGHILVLFIACRGDFILVGDLMKSFCLLQAVLSRDDEIVELARDYNANWMTAIAFLDDETYIGTENEFNLFVARKNADAATDEERGRLELVGEYHLGEFVNRFRKGSFTMQVSESGAAPLPTLLYGTINGVLGVVATLPAEQYAVLQKVQSALRNVIKGVGGLSHATWRSFTNDRKTQDAYNVVDGDLIEAYLELPAHKQQEVVKGLAISADELTKMVEDLARLH